MPSSSRKHYELVRRTVNKNGMHDKVWAVLTYRHEEPSTCLHTERVLAGVGVEGPRSLRFANCFLEATAVYPGDCPECEGVLEHDVAANEYLDPPQERNPELPYFRVPGKGTAE